MSWGYRKRDRTFVSRQAKYREVIEITGERTPDTAELTPITPFTSDFEGAEPTPFTSNLERDERRRGRRGRYRRRRRSRLPEWSSQTFVEFQDSVILESTQNETNKSMTRVKAALNGLDSLITCKTTDFRAKYFIPQLKEMYVDLCCFSHI
jgi:hypothetical protein